MNLSKRLKEIGMLQDGWFDGDGKAPSRELCLWLDRTLPRLLSATTTRPRLYPTLDGGIEAEWNGQYGSIVASFDWSVKSVNVTHVKHDGETGTDQTFSLVNDDGFSSASRCIWQCITSAEPKPN